MRSAGVCVNNILLRIAHTLNFPLPFGITLSELYQKIAKDEQKTLPRYERRIELGIKKA